MAGATLALAPLGIDTREWAVLSCLDDEDGLSQAEMAHKLGVDRTTMVGLVDELQRKSLVRREPDPEDRRKYRVELTPSGGEILEQGGPLVDEAERQFLASLSEPGARRLKSALRRVIARVP
jgi:DNA-binding MarR family transcriptional regulator